MTTLEEVAREASGCTKCRLSEGRTQVVFGDGHPNADLMFIGEGPGFHEDKQGVPFVGAAGQLLNRLLEEIGLARGDVYIANVVKCRPPGNRDPRPDEIEACTPWLLQQVDLIDPRLIVTLGNFATKLILDTTTGISRIRGERRTWRGKTVIPTFHPAAVLRGGGGGASTSRPRGPVPRGTGGPQMVALRADLAAARDLLAEMPPVPEEQLELF